jgi:MFS family permease
MPSVSSALGRFNSIQSSQTFSTITVTVAIYADLFVYSLVIPVLPILLAERVHIAPGNIQISLSGLLAAYNASVCVAAPIVAYLADRWKNRKIYLLGGLLALAGTTVLFMVLRTIGLLYLAQVLQGISAAVV